MTKEMRMRIYDEGDRQVCSPLMVLLLGECLMCSVAASQRGGLPVRP